MKFPKLAKDILQMVAIFAVIYFGNQQVQTYLGKKAIEETGIQALSFEEAVKESERTGKPIFAEFSAIWCPSCRKFNQNVLRDERVKQRLDESYVYTRLEYESDDKAYFERYGVKGFPTILVIEDKGGAAKRLPLSFESEAFLARL